MKSAHKISYLYYKGTIPENMYVLHHCDNRCCVNPEHLFLGTHKDNMDDMIKKNRQAVGSKCGASKLTDDQVRNIRADNRYQKDIAKDFNVSRSLISYIKRNKSWKHI